MDVACHHLETYESKVHRGRTRILEGYHLAEDNARFGIFGNRMLRPSLNHGTLWLHNDNDDDDDADNDDGDDDNYVFECIFIDFSLLTCLHHMHFCILPSLPKPLQVWFNYLKLFVHY